MGPPRDRAGGAFDRLAREAAGRVLVADGIPERYERDEGLFRVRPAAVLVAASPDDVEAAVAFCRSEGLPLTPRSGGTGLAGQSIGPGLVLDTGGLDPPPEVEGDTVRAAAGVTVESVKAALAPHGLRLGPDLTSAERARVGGMVATDAAGANSLVYGRTADSLVDLEAVLGTGERVVLGEARPLPRSLEPVPRWAGPGTASDARLRRRPSGYGLEGLAEGANPARLLCGSEGSLGVVLSARLRAFPVPPSRSTVALTFESVASAMMAVPGILETSPSAVELIDDVAMDGRWPGSPAALLVVEHTGGRPALGRPGEARELDRAEEAEVWGIRRSTLARLASADGPRPVALIEDACVPPDRLAEYVDGIRTLFDRLGVRGLFYGHAGAGCLHLRPFLDLRREEHHRAAATIVAEHADVVLAHGGSLSAEHGWGLARSWLLPRQFPAETVEAMRAVKRALDPDGIMNPGRVVGAQERFPAELVQAAT